MARGELKIAAPELRLDVEGREASLDWAEVFGGPGPIEIEVGIGKGRFLLAAAQARPEIHHLGIEWANKYLRVAEHRAARRELENVRFVRTDAKDFVHRLVPPESVDAYYVFYPDPWPKKRHHKRRFFSPDTVRDLVRTLRPGGWLHASTDHAEYWEVIETVLAASELVRQREFGGEAFPLPVDEPLTNFEVKYRVEGRGRFRGSWRLPAT
jgi:tRNA (guanine-N7-)-methyltransferase